MMRPVSSSIRFNVFFEPRGLQIALERPDVDESKYDRAKAFKKEAKFNDDSLRIVMGGELVRLACVAGAGWTNSTVAHVPIYFDKLTRNWIWDGAGDVILALLIVGRS